MERFTRETLRRLRNDIDLEDLNERVLQLPCKRSEGRFRFLCPQCSEFNSGINPYTNLARCFRCRKNFNPIDLVMAASGRSFVEAVAFLLSLA